MGMASHLGPWLLGTVKNSIASVSATNAAAGQNRNMGATLVTQTSEKITFATASGNTSVVIPAGSQIAVIKFIATTSVSASGTLQVGFNSNAATLTGNQNVVTVNVTDMASGADTDRAKLWLNTGTVDKVISYAWGGSPTTGEGYIQVSYVVRNSDGTTAPTSSQA